MNYILKRENFLKYRTNEGILSFIKGGVKMKKLKKFLEEYKQNVSDNYREKQDLKFKIKVSKDAGEDYDEFQEQLEILNDEEKNLKEQIENEKNGVKKDLDEKKKPQVDALILKTKKEINQIKREILEEMSKNKKYEDFDEIVQDLKKKKEQDKEMEDKLNDFTKELKSNQEDEESEEGDGKKFYFYTIDDQGVIGKLSQQKGDDLEMESGDKIDKENATEVKKGTKVEYKAATYEEEEGGDKKTYEGPIEDFDMENEKIIIDISSGTTDKKFSDILKVVDNQ